MEKEELITKVNDELGGTKLTISERTFNEEIDDVLGDFGDDEDANTTILSRLVKRLKRMDGNLHADVGAENRKYREQFEKDWKAKHPEPATTSREDSREDGGEPEWFKRYRKEQDAKYKAIEDERNAEKAKMQKEAVLKQVKDGVESLFAKAGIKPNGYILKQTMRDVDIPEKDADVERIIKSVEKSYYKNLKDAGIVEDTKPSNGGAGSGKIASALWEKKRAREGFGKAKKS